MKQFLLLAFLIVNCSSANKSKSKTNQNSMLQLEPKITVSRFSENIIVQDFDSNMTLEFDNEGELHIKSQGVFDLSFFSQDSSNAFHFNNEYALISYAYNGFKHSLESKAEAIILSEKKRKMAYVERSEQLNTGNLIIRSLENHAVLDSVQLPLLDIVKIQANSNLDFVVIRSASIVDNSNAVTIYNPSEINKDFESKMKNSKIYDFWLLNDTQIISTSDGIYVWCGANFLSLERNPNTAVVISPDREKLLIYHLEKLEKRDKLTIAYKILNANSLDLLKEDALDLDHAGLPQLLLSNNLNIRQVSYKEGKLIFSNLEVGQDIK